MSVISVLHQGQWKVAQIVGYGVGGSLMHAMLNETYIVMTVSGATFAPQVELVNGSMATVRWVDMSTGQQLGLGVNPTLGLGSSGTHRVGMRVEQQGAAAFGDVLTLNFGFNSGDDSGIYGIGSSYNYTSQPIIGISGLQVLTGLRRFLAAHTPLTGALDCSSLSALEFIECYQASVQSIDLTGCVNLVRLCMEANKLTSLDLNPVRHNLYDLRAAIQQGGSLHFATLGGPMDRLYHYCIRDQVVTNIVPHAQLPVIQQCWTWNTAQTTADAPISAVLNSYLTYENGYDQASVDRILVALDQTGPTVGGVDISGGTSAAPSATGLTAKANLQGKGWTVTTN